MCTFQLRILLLLLLHSRSPANFTTFIFIRSKGIMFRFKILKNTKKIQILLIFFQDENESKGAQNAYFIAVFPRKFIPRTGNSTNSRHGLWPRRAALCRSPHWGFPNASGHKHGVLSCCRHNLWTVQLLGGPMPIQPVVQSGVLGTP